MEKFFFQICDIIQNKFVGSSLHYGKSPYLNFCENSCFITITHNIAITFDGKPCSIKTNIMFVIGYTENNIYLSNVHKPLFSDNYIKKCLSNKEINNIIDDKHGVHYLCNILTELQSKTNRFLDKEHFWDNANKEVEWINSKMKYTNRKSWFNN